MKPFIPAAPVLIAVLAIMFVIIWATPVVTLAVAQETARPLPDRLRHAVPPSRPPVLARSPTLPPPPGTLTQGRPGTAARAGGLKTASISRDNAARNLEIYFLEKGLDRGVVICDGVRVHLGSVSLLGVHAFEPVTVIPDTGVASRAFRPQLHYLKATLFFRGLVDSDAASCGGQTVSGEIEAVRLAAPSAGPLPGAWFVPAWGKPMVRQ